ncbi:hypothetical protein PanWU01x14_177630 [Parasponia andersonii]|uniref:Uncharacterized protein n=1 Tax=Parasponia andersonii TaxID=3476 RepID=A0A2P5C787_PARAD|nr:hypothetical protein PanWU01x14_177630 [Parasponia andersonii]
MACSLSLSLSWGSPCLRSLLPQRSSETWKLLVITRHLPLLLGVAVIVGPPKLGTPTATRCSKHALFVQPPESPGVVYIHTTPSIIWNSRNNNNEINTKQYNITV